MSAFARLAIMTLNPQPLPPNNAEDGPARELEELAQAALKAAPPPPPPVITFAPSGPQPAAWFIRLRESLSR